MPDLIETEPGKYEFKPDMQGNVQLCYKGTNMIVGDRIPQHEPGAKEDYDKPDMSLLLNMGKALAEIAKVGTYGKNKYTRDGWEVVPDGINRYTAAMLRHVALEYYSDTDDESEMLHAAMTAWNAVARLELILREREKN